VTENALFPESLLRKRTACSMAHVVEDSLEVPEIAVYQAPMVLGMPGDQRHLGSGVHGGQSLVVLDYSTMGGVVVSPYG